MFDKIIGQVGFRHNPTKDSMHIVFNINSFANCYRKRQKGMVWIINIFNDKVNGLFIKPFHSTDLIKLQEILVQRASLDIDTLTKVFSTLKQYKRE